MGVDRGEGIPKTKIGAWNVGELRGNLLPRRGDRLLLGAGSCHRGPAPMIRWRLQRARREERQCGVASSGAWL
uniref:Uncharacterized protein n=1 Tax=Oryza barthii TaxID=65489 RepID=A0A0D3GNS5_9ORYZ